MTVKKKPIPKKTSSKKTTKKKTATGINTSRKTPQKPVERAMPASELSCVAGIGASAGGLEALEGFIAGVAVPNSMAFVIVQHLAPGHKSIMGTLLARHTNMNISEIKDGMKILPNTIYLNLPGREVSVLKSRLYLTEPVESHAARLPIDYFLRSLAADQREKAVGIILSGTGTDGTLGLKAIKGEGGMTMAQSESQAKYDSMPRSAINTGMVDFILPVEKMGEELVRYSKHPYIEGPLRSDAPQRDFLTNAQKIFLLIRSVTGHDFSNYKQNTIRRRIERRMAVHQISRVEDYYRFLRENTVEIETLFKDMLINVTSFFRDPEAFAVLEKEVIPSIIEKKNPDGSLRIWVPGCATGEEAYSIAILVQEAMEKKNRHLNVQIFASDIDADSIEFARAGVYPESIAADVPPKRLKRYFTKLDGAYAVKKQVRETLVFAVQNLIKDPPFSRLDLVSCRNLLIYLDSVLQKKVLTLFHYTLLYDGILLLGTSESIGEFAEYFSPVSTKWKVFRRKGISMERRREHYELPFSDTSPGMDNVSGRKTIADPDIRSIAEGLILQNFAPGCVFVNDKFDIVYFQGRTEAYLSSPPGEPTFNILKMAHEDLRYKLSTMLHKAVKQKKTVSAGGIQVHHEGRVREIDLIVRPLPGHLAPPGMMMVVFDDRMASGKSGKKPGRQKAASHIDDSPRTAALEQELQSTREYLQTTIEELETSNEELKSTNEELQSTNEELQSTNEEMETSKEELQSTNEELETVNAELQSRVEELSRANNDLNNLLASTDIGTIFLDADLSISRFTPSATRIYNLIQTDLGRPISDITSKSEYKNIARDAQGVLETLILKEMDIKLEGGETYHMRIIPYRTVDNVIDGVVITFVDVSELKQTEELKRLAAVVRDSNDAITLLSPDGAITAWNRGAEKMYGYTEKEALRMNIAQIVPPGNREENLDLMKKVTAGESIASFRTKRITKNGRAMDVWLTVTRLVDSSGNITSIATTEREITKGMNI